MTVKNYKPMLEELYEALLKTKLGKKDLSSLTSIAFIFSPILDTFYFNINGYILTKTAFNTIPPPRYNGRFTLYLQIVAYRLHIF